ncbi:MAG: hypothetical protein IJ896_05095 [Fibrobacter sp.]|jgi:hypothetical protein|nr:hypothetical protein [Fibrobacter sp.]
MILEKDEVDVILQALENAGHKDMADKIKAVAEEPLPPDFEYDDYPEEAPLLEIRKAF